MEIIFKINYHTNWGESLFIELFENGKTKNTRHKIEMRYNNYGEWSAVFSTRKKNIQLSYKYYFQQDNKEIPEAGALRNIDIKDSKSTKMTVVDNWRSLTPKEGIFETAMFTRVVAQNGKKVAFQPKENTLVVEILAPVVPENSVVAIAGNTSQLGNWTAQPLCMNYTENGVWRAEIDIKDIDRLEYKCCIFNIETEKILYWEYRNNREINYFPHNSLLIHDSTFSYGSNWKGAGLAIPVFSIRTDDGYGVGEFNDIKKLTDWCCKTGLKMIQILPINETVASHSWLDSYPYKAISVNALHPMYLHIESLGKFSSKKEEAAFLAHKIELNKKEAVDYVRMMEIKSKYYKYFYDKQKKQVFKKADYKKFFEANKEWLVPYAVFACLRDKFGTANFREWDMLSTFDPKEVEVFASEKSKHYDDVAVHFYIQYQLHCQLLEAVDYAHSKGVALKGDIPIGISRDSVDAWVEPELFNLNGQAGAPPDDFAVNGQNWGFPTYKWDVMAKDNFAWWQKRMKKMSEYFDAYRIDHILGFFRIWEIPIDATQGLLGYFNPALPLTRNELQEKGLNFDDDRFVNPYIHQWFLGNIFGEYTQQVIDQYLEPKGWEIFQLKEAFNTQQKISTYFDNLIAESNDSKWVQIRDGLLTLAAEVLFIKDPNQDGYHPRISLHNTYSYQSLNDEEKELVNQIYVDFFYHRHDEFWKYKAMEKLPVLINATNMLVCGEDLGMIPATVPGVMSDLGILSLEIQRMPKDQKIEFGHPADYPYRSVASPSTHDMSTIRGWWEESTDKTQLFYNQILGNYGEAPYFCEPWVAKQIITQHNYSPAMLVIYPIQDLLAIDGELRWDKTEQERINVPSNPKHYWRYRMKQRLEDLLIADDFNHSVKQMFEESER